MVQIILASCLGPLSRPKPEVFQFLSTKTIPYEHHNVISDTNGRYVIISGKLFNANVALANIYAPNSDDVGFFKHFFSSLPDLGSYSLILGGDFKCWLDPVLDWSSSNPGIMSKSAVLIRFFILEYSVSDVWRYLYPNRREYLFFPNVHHTFSWIDYFLIDNQILPSVCSCVYQSIVVSDHATVTLSLNLPGLPPIKKQRRFNSTLLSDNAFMQFIKEQITFFLHTNSSPETSSLIVWDALKAYLSGHIISYTVNMKKKARKERQEVANQIKIADLHYAQFDDPRSYKKRVELTLTLSTYPIEYQLLKSKSQFNIHGDKSGKMLANYLRGSKAKQLITQIEMENGNITTDHVQINDTFRNYYARLYTSEFPTVTNQMVA